MFSLGGDQGNVVKPLRAHDIQIFRNLCRGCDRIIPHDMIVDLLCGICGKLIAAAEKTNAANRHKFVALAASLDAMSPLKVLGRGYAIASSESGELIKSVGDVNKGDKLSLSVSDGLIKCTVDESEAKSHG